MNVRELIKRLKKFDGNLPVAVEDCEAGEYGVDGVRLDNVSQDNLKYFTPDMKAGGNIVIIF